MTDDTTRVISALERMRGRAPDSLLPGVLAATGIADRYTTVAGPVGPLCVAWNDRGVTAVAPARESASFAADYEAESGRTAVRVDALPDRLERRIARALKTGRPGDISIDLSRLSPFQQAVLEATAQIPKGEMRPYWWVAKEMGRPGAARAVGNALNRNPVPVLIPCHRVGRSDGSVGRYAYGEPMKRDLLLAEGLDPDEVEATAARGTRFVGSDTTGIYCLPTCRHARRITEKHREEFRSQAEASGAGYRPCRVCRPAAA